MNNGTIKTEVVDIKNETPDVKTFRFKPVNGEEISFLPGQFVFLYVNFEKENNVVRRAYSIANAPTKNNFIDLTLKLTPGGKVTTYFFNKVKEHDTFELSKPMGKFIFDENIKKDIVLLAGGAGIVPMKSMIQYCTDKNLDNKIKLFYSCKTPENIIYKHEFEKLEKQNPNLKIIYTMTQEEWKGHTGRIDIDLLKKNIDNFQNKIYYVCGPLAMIRSMANMLMDLGVDRKNIKRDVWV